MQSVCIRPPTDTNLDGATDKNDSYVKLWNGYTTSVEFANWRLALALGPAGDICQTTDPQNTYIAPRYTLLYPQRGKTVYNSDLKNLMGLPFDMPMDGVAAVVALCDYRGRTVDRIDFTAENGRCVIVR